MEQQYSKMTLFVCSLRKGPFSSSFAAATLPPGTSAAMPLPLSVVPPRLCGRGVERTHPVSYTHLRAHETRRHL
eukprot:12422558-Prorocentrum_lima.AAC.1